MIRAGFALVCALTIGLFASAAQAKMVALVVGNWDYRHVPQLRNPHADALAITEAFQKLGFEVETALNQDLAGFRGAVDRFRARAEGADTAVFFYAGHGMEIDGANYLIPVDATLSRPGSAPDEALLLSKVNRAAAQASRLSVVLVDACRNNAFPRATRSVGAGFGRAEPQLRQVVTFSTAPGALAYDGEGDVSPFTQALIEILPKALDYDVRQVFGGLGNRVSELAKAEQYPYTETVGFSIDTVRLVEDGQSAIEPPKNGTQSADAAAPKQENRAAPARAPAPEPVQVAFAGPAPQPFATSRPVNPPEAKLSFETAAAPMLAPPASAVAAPQPYAGAAGPADFDVFSDCASCPQMVALPAGGFRMGASSFSYWAERDELPSREVRVERFAIGRYEASFKEWDACVRDGFCQGARVSDYGWGRGPQPVLRASYKDIVAPGGFIDWLNSKVEGEPYRLPSEAEWEYAARAGGGEDYATGDSISFDQARFGGLDTENAVPRQPSAVGRFPPNRWGLHDMHGNVAELVADCWNPNHEGAPQVAVARTTGRCGKAPAKGGSWADPPQLLRITAREPQGRGARSNRLGFRVARSLP